MRKKGGAKDYLSFVLMVDVANRSYNQYCHEDEWEEAVECCCCASAVICGCGCGVVQCWNKRESEDQCYDKENHIADVNLSCFLVHHRFHHRLPPSRAVCSIFILICESYYLILSPRKNSPLYVYRILFYKGRIKK